MAAAVQTNLSVAFTHGAQLTMDHCGALIRGAAILWSRLPSQAPQETLPCNAVPLTQPLTPFRWEQGEHLVYRSNHVCFHVGTVSFYSRGAAFALVFWASCVYLDFGWHEMGLHGYFRLEVVLTPSKYYFLWFKPGLLQVIWIGLHLIKVTSFLDNIGVWCKVLKQIDSEST